MKLKGALVAATMWFAALLCAYALEAGEGFFPHWLRDLDMPDTIGSFFSLIAFPISLGGWLLIWGDSARPFPWIDSIAFNVCFGIVFYGLAGGGLAYLVEKKNGKSIRFLEGGRCHCRDHVADWRRTIGYGVHVLIGSVRLYSSGNY